MAISGNFQILLIVILILCNIPVVSSKTKHDISPETFAKLLQIVAGKEHVFDNRNILDTHDSGTHWKPLTPYRTIPWQQPKFVRPKSTSIKKRSKFPRHIEMNRRQPSISNDQERIHENLQKLQEYQKQRNGPNIPKDLLYQLRLLVQATMKEKNEITKNHLNQHHLYKKNKTLYSDNEILFSNKSTSKRPTPKSEDIDTSDKNHTHSLSHVSVSTQETLTLTPQSLSTTLDSIINHQVSVPLSSAITTTTTKENRYNSNKMDKSHLSQDTNGYWSPNYQNLATKPSVASESVEEPSSLTTATSESASDNGSQWKDQNVPDTSTASKGIVKYEFEVGEKPTNYRIAGEVKRDTVNKWTTHVAGLGPRSGFISNKKLSTVSNNTDLKDWTTIEDVVELKNTTRKNHRERTTMKVQKTDDKLNRTDSNLELESTTIGTTMEEKKFNRTMNETQWSKDVRPKSRQGGTILKETLHDNVLTEAYMEYFATSYISIISICVAFILLGNIVVYKFYRRQRIMEEIEWRRQGSLSDQSELY